MMERRERRQKKAGSPVDSGEGGEGKGDERTVL